MAEINVEQSIQIDRPADEVFAFIADHKNALKFHRGLHSVEATGNGQVKMVRKHFGHRHEVEGEMRPDPASRTITFTGQVKTHHGPRSTRTEETVTPNGDSSSTYTVKFHSDEGNAPGPVLDHAHKVVAHEINGDLEHLKQLLEAPDEYHAHVREHVAAGG